MVIWDINSGVYNNILLFIKEGMAEHIPVLLKEVIEILSPKDNAVYFDGTFGGGGYTQAILAKVNCRLIATDRDEHVREIADSVKNAYGERFSFYHAKFSEIKRIIAAEKLTAVDGIVLDLGVSNFQLEDANRGFSFKHTGPLNMSMGLNKLTALDIIHKYSERDLANLIYEFGEEPFSRRIAKNIKLHLREIRTTTDLANVIHNSIGNRGKTDSATKTFQALRICVNDELEQLQSALKSITEVLKPNGKIIVVSFHSLEDRIVKLFFRELAKNGNFELYSKKPISPSIEELQNNPKSRSAKLRCVIRK